MDIFNTLFTAPLANGLIVFYRIVGNLGLAIIIFSVFLRVVLLPLTKPYMESMKKMREHAEEIKKIKDRHKSDRMKAAQAQADFYKTKGINPSAGCLPYLLQIVVLIFLFRLFSTVFAPDVNIAQEFNRFLYQPLAFGAQEQVGTSFLYLDLAKPDTLNSVLGIDAALPIPGVFLLLSAFLQFVSAKIAIPYIEAEKKAVKQTKEKSDDFMVSMQSSMIYMFPFITIIIGVSFPSGLALYWFAFSAFQVWQQYSSTGWGGATPWVNKLRALVKSS